MSPSVSDIILISFELDSCSFSITSSALLTISFLPILKALACHISCMMKSKLPLNDPFITFILLLSAGSDASSFALKSINTIEFAREAL